MKEKSAQDLSKKDSSLINFNPEEKISLCVDYHELLEATSDIIFAIGNDQKIAYINSAWKILYPSKKDKVIGSSYLELVPDYEQERAVYVFDSVVKKGLVIENELLKTYSESGRVFYFLISFAPIKNNDKIVGGIGVMKNITDTILTQKKLKANAKILEEKVKEQLRQSKELSLLSDFNHEIIAKAPFGILVMDPSGIMLSENPALITMMGRKLEDTIVGVNLLKHPGFIEAGFSKIFEEVFSIKKTVRLNNVSYVPVAGGEEIIINVTAHPIFDKNGLLEKVLGMVEDNTEQARVADKINRAEKLFSIGSLASGIAYELRLPINVMAMDLNFVANNIEESSPAIDYVSSLKKELHRIKNLSEQLLALASSAEVQGKECDLNKIFLDYPLEALLKRLEGEGFKVVLDLPTDSLFIQAAASQVIQILIDLIENAEEAMPDKGEIKILAEKVEVAERNFVALTVWDNGVGIPSEQINKIFQPFFTTKGKEATGLGLMIIATVVENLGGSIGIKSKVGEGTIFKILLPLAEKKNG